MERRVKAPLSFVFFPLILATCLFGQQSQLADSPASREDVLKLFKVMNLREQMHLVMDSAMEQQKQLFRDTMHKQKPGITDQELARVENMIDESIKDFPIDGMLDDMIPVYQKHLTRTDVEAMVGFYSSPTGQKLLREMPAMTSEGMQAAYGRMQEQMEKTMQRVKQTIKEEQKRQPATAKPPPQPRNE